MTTQKLSGDVQLLDGDLELSTEGKKLKFRGSAACDPGWPRSSLLQESNAVYSLPLKDCFVWDSGADLPTSAAADDLALIPGTYGTTCPYLSAGDLKAAGATTRRARRLVPLPVEYVAGETVTIRLSAGMLTTVASASCTVDIEAYLVKRDTLVDGSDLCDTAAQTMNSLSFANKDFNITATALEPGDLLDVRISIACNDAATVTAVTPAIAAMDLVCDIKG